MASVSTSLPLSIPPPSRWEIAAESIVVRIRWFGVVAGYLLINLAGGERVMLLNGLLALGAAYTLIDTVRSAQGRILLGRYPLIVSVMEAAFIGLLCYCHEGLESPFRYYYFLSLICCALRHATSVTYATCALHGMSCCVLALAAPTAERPPLSLLFTLVVLGWLTWASTALAILLRRVGDYLGELNVELREHQSLLEARIAERTRQLQESQAHVLHQEKMAAFGLLAAGIAHEVGNPLTAISSLVQILQSRECDAYTAEKLSLVSSQLQRIQGTLRELINFSRPASTTRERAALGELLDEAFHIAKYYKRTGDRVLKRDVPPGLPPLFGVRDQLVQVFLNLLLNALDATRAVAGRGPRVEVAVTARDGYAEVVVSDNGTGIAPEHRNRLFQPYFTTKPHGTGLGLFVTRKLVEAHGGTIEVAATPGEGTAFTVRIPLCNH